MNIDEWKSQIRRGTLEFCILAMISNQDLFGRIQQKDCRLENTIP